MLGAAGHQALLQPEGLLLGARLRVVIPHQAPLDLEIMTGMWAQGLVTCELHPIPTPAKEAPSTFCQTSSVRSGALR